jgi:hypothetical protein
VAKPITIREKVKAEGFDAEILRNQRLSEKDIDEACFFTFFDISSSSLPFSLAHTPV